MLSYHIRCHAFMLVTMAFLCKCLLTFHLIPITIMTIFTSSFSSGIGSIKASISAIDYENRMYIQNHGGTGCWHNPRVLALFTHVYPTCIVFVIHINVHEVPVQHHYVPFSLGKVSLLTLGAHAQRGLL